MSQHQYPFGGAFLPEELLAPIQALKIEWEKMKTHQSFLAELSSILKNYAGRATPLTEVKNFARAIHGPRVFLKREDLLHTGAHKINNALGQCLLAKYLGKNRVVAETGAGQHGVATATACAYLGLDCAVYMGAKDVERQKPNVEKMRFLGAEVVSVAQGSCGLKDAVNQALQDWAKTHASTHYCLGSALGPEPYPDIVRFFQSVISAEVKEQIHAATGEGGGLGIVSGKHAARFATGRPGIFHGFYSYLLQDSEGQVLQTHSISAGLDYPSVGPDHAAMHESGRAFYTSATDEEALQAFFLLTRNEGIIPALESSHALAHLVSIAPSLPKDHIVIVNLSGRGDKDLPQIIKRNGGMYE